MNFNHVTDRNDFLICKSIFKTIQAIGNHSLLDKLLVQNQVPAYPEKNSLQSTKIAEESKSALDIVIGIS